MWKRLSVKLLNIDYTTMKKYFLKNIKTTILLVIINGFKECHIQPDWLLIYKIENDKLTLTVSRTGTHSDLF